MSNFGQGTMRSIRNQYQFQARKQEPSGKCAGCNQKRPYARMTLHTGLYYDANCLRYVNGELEQAMAENKWDHEFDPRPNQWWPA